MKIKEVQIEHPYYGYRRIWREINKNGGDTTETTVRRVMRRFGITAVFPGKNLSKACKYHKKYPYLLRNKVIRYPNQISQWKAQAIAGLAVIFERPNKKSEETRKQEEEKDSLLKTIGEQKVEIDFLKKKYKQIYGYDPIL